MSMTLEKTAARFTGGRSPIFTWTMRVVLGTVLVSGVVMAGLLVFKGAGPKSLVIKPVTLAELIFPRDSDGRYYIDAEINNRRVRFFVDPSLRQTVLAPDDARSIGLSDNNLKFTDRVATPDGETPAAPVTVRELRINTLTLFDAKLEIADRPLPMSIAGKSFLDRFSSYELKPDKLILRQ